jgi:hypothetical protein
MLASPALTRPTDATGGQSNAREQFLGLEDSDSLDSAALDALIECEQGLARAGCTLILARVRQNTL